MLPKRCAPRRRGERLRPSSKPGERTSGDRKGVWIESVKPKQLGRRVVFQAWGPDPFPPHVPVRDVTYPCIMVWSLTMVSSKGRAGWAR
jgi:hypothetical protein